MQTKIYGAIGLAKKVRIDLPEVFETPYRPDIIRRAVLAVQSTRRHPKGTKYHAGWVAATSWGPGRGASRTPRTHGQRTHHAQRGALVNYTVGGRVAHPPLTEKRILEAINRKERRLAIKSAIAATSNKKLVLQRGHNAENFELLPIVFEDEVHEKIAKTKDAIDLFTKIGIMNDINRVKEGKKIRAGKGKGRGRKYQNPVGPLVVIDRKSDFCNAIQNLPGVDIVLVKYLNAEMLAPGTYAGRLTIWMEKSLNALNQLHPSKSKVSHVVRKTSESKGVGS